MYRTEAITRIACENGTEPPVACDCVYGAKTRVTLLDLISIMRYTHGLSIFPVDARTESGLIFTFRCSPSKCYCRDGSEVTSLDMILSEASRPMGWSTR